MANSGISHRKVYEFRGFSPGERRRRAPVNESHVEDRELVLFYQLLHALPPLGALFYREELNEAFRAWLMDLYHEAPIREQRWLGILYLYYGLHDGQPVEYKKVGEIVQKTPSTVRDQAARALRYLWQRARVRKGDLNDLFLEALIVNEWPTSDVSQEISLGFFELLLDEHGEFSGSGKTPTAEDREELPPRPNLSGLDVRPVSLWHPEYAGKLWPQLGCSDHVIFMRRGVLLKP